MTGALVPAFSSSAIAAPRTEDVASAPAQAHRLSALDDLVRGFLLSKRSATTRAAYTADLASWLHWCTRLELDPLWAGIHHADAYLRLLTEVGDPRTGRTLAAASVARRTSAVHGFYRYAARHGAVAGSPFTGVSRPAVDEESMTSGLTRDEVHALYALPISLGQFSLKFESFNNS